MRWKMCLILLSMLILSSCGHNTEHSKGEFQNNVLVTNNATVKIKEIFIIDNKESEKREVVFKFEIKRTGSKQVVPSTFFLANFNIEQGSEQLVTGFGANTIRKFDELVVNNHKVVKSGETVEGIISYELENRKKLKIKASREYETLDVTSLKRYDYAAKN